MEGAEYMQNGIFILIIKFFYTENFWENNPCGVNLEILDNPLMVINNWGFFSSFIYIDENFLSNNEYRCYNFVLPKWLNRRNKLAVMLLHVFRKRKV